MQTFNDVLKRFRVFFRRVLLFGSGSLPLGICKTIQRR